MEKYKFTIIVEPDEDSFHAYVPALPGCHSFGATIDEAQSNISEAIALHVECMKKDGETIRVEKQPLVITQMTVTVPL